MQRRFKRTCHCTRLAYCRHGGFSSGICRIEMLEILGFYRCIAGRLMRKPLIPALLLVSLFALTSIQPCRLAAQAAPQDRGPGERRRVERSPIELASGAKVEFSSFTSAALKEDREFSIYLPPTYA